MHIRSNARYIRRDCHRLSKSVDLSAIRVSRDRATVTYLPQSGGCVHRDLISGNFVSQLFFEEKRINVDYSLKLIERCHKPPRRRYCNRRYFSLCACTRTHARMHVCTQHIDMTQDGLQCHTSKNKTQTSRRVHRPDHLRTRVNICEILSRLRTPYLTPINSLSANLPNSLSSGFFETMPTSLLYKAETSDYEKGDKKFLTV